LGTITELQEYVAGIAIDLTKQKLTKEREKMVDSEFNPILTHMSSTEAEEVLKNNKNLRIITDKETDTIWLWTQHTGTYSEDGEALLKIIIKKGLGPELAEPYTVENIIKSIKSGTKAEIKPSRLIAVKNGILNIKANNVQLVPFTPTYFITTRIPTTYTPTANNPEWRTFIEDICPDDHLLLQEWSGYMLFKGYPVHALMWLYGPLGFNAKGTFIRAIKKVIGEHNSSSISIEDIMHDKPFALANLTNKLVNISPEPSIKKDLSTDMIKSVTGEDIISTDTKYQKKRGQLFNHAKITLMGNDFPRGIPYGDVAFWQRFLCCCFPNTYIGEKANPRILEELTDTEEKLSVILNWMIEGLQRLLKNKWVFSNSKTVDEKRELYALGSDSAKAFLEQHIEFPASGNISKKDLTATYEAFCYENKLVPKDTLNQALLEFAEARSITPLTSSRTYDSIKKTHNVCWNGMLFIKGPLNTKLNREYNNNKYTIDTSATAYSKRVSIENEIRDIYIEVYELHGTHIICNKKSFSTDRIDRIDRDPEPVLPETYSLSQCYFCQCPVEPNDSICDDFTEGKPAHQKCYEELYSTLKNKVDNTTNELIPSARTIPTAGSRDKTARAPISHIVKLKDKLQGTCSECDTEQTLCWKGECNGYSVKLCEECKTKVADNTSAESVTAAPFVTTIDKCTICGRDITNDKWVNTLDPKGKAHNSCREKQQTQLMQQIKESNLKLQKIEAEQAKVTLTPNSATEPPITSMSSDTWYMQQIPKAEQCSCSKCSGANSVEFIVTDPENAVHRCCVLAVEELKKQFEPAGHKFLSAGVVTTPFNGKKRFCCDCARYDKIGCIHPKLGSENYSNSNWANDCKKFMVPDNGCVTCGGCQHYSYGKCDIRKCVVNRDWSGRTCPCFIGLEVI
jgi:putative DNA primase/helicase